MLILSVVYVVVALLPDIAVLSPDDLEFLDGLLWIVWGIFATELLVKIFVSPKPLQYMMQNWPDVLIVAMPFLRPLRFLRICWCCPKRGDKPNRFCAKNLQLYRSDESFYCAALCGVCISGRERNP